MNPRALPNPLKRNEIYLALAACGIVATAVLAPDSAMATRPMFRVTAFEAMAPLDRNAGASAQPVDAGGVAARTWGAGKAVGGPGVPIAQTPAPTFDQPALSFTTPLGTTSLTQRTTMTNLSGYPCSIFVDNNGLGSSFFYSGTCPAALPDGSSCSFDLGFRPFDFNPDTGTLSVFATCGPSFGNPTVSLSGVASRSPTPLVQTSPPALDFPPTPVADFSDVQFLTLRSVSQVGMNVGTAGVGDILVLPSFAPLAPPEGPGVAKGRKAPPPSFAGNCFGFLSPMQSCDLGVVFAPTALGDRTGLVLISTDISQNQLAVSARGIGRTGAGVSPLTVTDRIDFGEVPVGATSTPRPFGIVNNTGGPAAITELSVLGDFEVQKGTCDTVAPAEACTANLLFKPTALGPRAGSVTVKSSVDPNAYVTPLAGTGVVNPNPFLSLSATELGYGSGIVGGGEALNLTITSTGQVPALISRIYALGDFIPTHTCPSSLGPGQSCTIEVGFSPRLTGLRTGSLVVESNAVGSPHSVVLKGTGCTFFSASARGRTLLCSPN